MHFRRLYRTTGRVRGSDVMLLLDLRAEQPNITFYCFDLPLCSSANLLWSSWKWGTQHKKSRFCKMVKLHMKMPGNKSWRSSLDLKSNITTHDNHCSIQFPFESNWIVYTCSIFPPSTNNKQSISLVHCQTFLLTMNFSTSTIFFQPSQQMALFIQLDKTQAA